MGNKIENIVLNNGVAMPPIGFGVFQITDLKECERCVCDAVEVGYRAIDTAAHYQNEEAVGEGVRHCGIPRDQLFITSKLMVKDAGYEKTLKAFDASLKRLGMDYLDLYLIHHAYGDCYGSWRAMEKLYKEGYIRAIGVSNFEPYRLVDILLNNEVIPAVDQTETHPYCQQVKLKETMKEWDIKLIASEGLAQGERGLFTDPTFTKIGEKYNKTAAQVVLRWHFQRGDIIIPKSVNKSRMQQNFDIFDFELSQEDMEAFVPYDTGNGIFGDRRDPERVKKFCLNLH